MKISSPTLLGWNELLNRSRQFSNVRALSAANSLIGTDYSEATGWHVYTHLSWPVRISAAETEKDARNYLNLIQTYTTLTERSGAALGLEILEVQGKRIHLFLEEAVPTTEGLNRIHIFGRVLLTLIDEFIRPQVEEGRLSFTVATDHGAAFMLLSTLQDESESLVSLGRAANTPAKKLNRGVTASHLAYDRAVFISGRADARWEEINLVSDGALRRPTEQALATARIGLDQIILENRAASLQGFNAQFLPQPDHTADDPLTYQGFMFRADLTGFSARVDQAMAGSPADKLRLITEFTEILQYPAEFKNRLAGKARVLLFPWAGDCANLLLVPEDYDFARSFLPHLAANEWHAQRSLENRAKNPWQTYLAENSWVVGIAGGDNGDSDHGRVLVGQVVAYQRNYLIGAGWGWGRSDDAVQAETTRADDTVITNEDYLGLNSSYQAAYRPLNSLFHRASHNAIQRAKSRTVEALADSKPFSLRTAGSLVTMPAPRPHAS